MPDPASRFQPEDVHGAERSDRPGVRLAGATTGAAGRGTNAAFLSCTSAPSAPKARFRAVIDKLDHVAETGFTAIELMPVADFAGRWNWGYDGVLLFAPDSAYGRPDDLKALIDAAHQRGLMVFLDVVYNHFGPEGNYLGRYAPQFFAAPAQTPWGSAIDYQVAGGARFAIENALHWLDEFRFDGLRLDAVHAIVEPGRSLLLRELSERAGALAAATGRHIHLVLENDDNQAQPARSTADPPRGKYRAQWNDDYHHAFHVLLTGETTGYYRDYRDLRRHVARTLAEGFAYQGEPSPHRGGATRGEPTAARPATAFVNFLQNHDQIGNRALGERLTALAPARALEAALAITLLAPMPPLLFMGEEWGAREPFPFFCDFQGELAEAVRQGRRKEFAEAYADATPTKCPIRFRSRRFARHARLDAQSAARHRERLDLVRRLLARAQRVRRAAAAGAAGRTWPTAVRRRRSCRALDIPRRRDAVDPCQSERPDRAAALRRCRWRSRSGAARRRRDAGAVVGPCCDRGVLMPPTIPLATYRLQLSKDFGFDDAARLVPYLKALGITHLYASPFLKARAGSKHGYDIVDHSALNPEFGGEDGFARLSDALQASRPRPDPRFRAEPHGGRPADNAWWLDVLEWGRASPHAASFDIGWELLPYRHGGGVLLPVLGKPYGEALTSGEIELQLRPEGRQLLGLVFRAPLSDQSAALQRHPQDRRRGGGCGRRAGRPELLALADEHGRPGAPSYAQAPAFKRRLAGIEGAAPIIERGLAAYRADHEAGTQALHRLLERQHYRLAYWRLAVSGINYRRFFDINDLAGLRVEDPRTFRAMHELVARLIAAGHLQGLRLDHIDGLLDPLQYSRRLQQLIRKIRGANAATRSMSWSRKSSRDGETDAALPRRRRHHRLRMAQPDLARPGR